MLPAVLFWSADNTERGLRVPVPLRLVQEGPQSPDTPGNAPSDKPGAPEPIGRRFRALSCHLARIWALAAGSSTLSGLRTLASFYEAVRVWMGNFDAQERQASGQPVPAKIQRMLAGLVARSTAAGKSSTSTGPRALPKPTLSELTPAYSAAAQRPANLHLAIQALRDLLISESAAATRNNLVRQRAFLDRLQELMNRYTNQQPTSAQVIAELIELAREGAAATDHGDEFNPPLSTDELIARELVANMRRDVKADWTVRDDVRRAEPRRPALRPAEARPGALPPRLRTTAPTGPA